MSKNELSDDEGTQDERSSRGDVHRLRRSQVSRRRNRQKGLSIPGGVRQRRNKHWNW